MEDDTGEMKVKDETTSVASHFLLRVQFFGFSGSSSPSQVTYKEYCQTILVALVKFFELTH